MLEIKYPLNFTIRDSANFNIWERVKILETTIQKINNLGSSFNYYDDVVPTNDGIFVVSSYTTIDYPTHQVGNVNPAPFVLKYSLDGNLIENFPTQSSYTEVGRYNSLLLTQSGKLIIAGNVQNSQPFMYKIDTASGVRDLSFQNSTINIGKVNRMVEQSDGKILVAGNFVTYSGVVSPSLVRINSDNTVDTSFKVGDGFKTNGNFGAIINSLALEDNGKILVGGLFNFYSSSLFPVSGIVRLNPNGDIDTTFRTSGVEGPASSLGSYDVKEIIVQPDKKIFITGFFARYSGSNEATRSIVRINPSGSIDSDFKVDFGLRTGNSMGDGDSAVLQPDNKIIVVGNFTSYSGSSTSPFNVVNNIVRINSSGSIDTDFNQGGGSNIDVGINDIVTLSRVRLDSNNKIIVVGKFNKYSSSFYGEYDNIIRINPSGSADTTFISTGSRSTDTVTDNASSTGFLDFNVYQKDWYLRRIKKLTTDRFAVLGKFNRVGDLKKSFNGCIIIDSNSNIINENFYTSSFTGIGQGGSDDTIADIVVQSDGKYVIGGEFSFYGLVSSGNVKNIIRVNSDFSQDDSFKTGSGFTSTIYSSGGDSVYTLDIEVGTQKIYAGGVFNRYSGSTAVKIARINTNGSYDSSFSTGTGFGPNEAIVRKIIVQNDGKILVGGSFDTYNGSSYKSIVRLNPDGTVDSDFKIGTGSGDRLIGQGVYNILTQSNGQIVLAGSFVGFSGSNSYNDIIRINSSGSVDDNFKSGTGMSGTYTTIGMLKQNTDGSYLVGYNHRPNSVGDAAQYSGSNIPGATNLISGRTDIFQQKTSDIFKINSDGTLDTSFRCGVGGKPSSTQVRSTVISDGEFAEDGGLYVVGAFNILSSSYISALGKINPSNGNLWTIQQ